MIAQIGTQLKLGIILRCEDLTHKDLDFELIFFTNCREEGLKYAKSKLLYYEEGDFYIATVDTRWLSSGDLLCKVLTQIPDTDFPNGMRKELLTVDTSITLVRGR